MYKRLAAVMLLCSMAVGCATDNAAVRERDGVAYGVTEGVFRGRWWSYYERGVSFLSGQFYEEARADFEQALAGYSRDTWRARTYGLHFVEFFPNRELGVAYFQLGRLDEAEQVLRRSLDFVDTERAHYYLDQITKERIRQGQVQDMGDPAMTVDAPMGAIVAVRQVPLQITAQDDVAVGCVMVNGKQYYQRGSQEQLAFSEELLLKEGPQTIQLEAMDLADKKTVQEYAVTVDLTGPNVGLYAPVEASITELAAAPIEGVAVDKNGVVSVSLGEQVLAEAPGGAPRLEFKGDATLQPGENNLILIAKDVAGNETRTAISVFQGKPGSPAARLWQLDRRNPQALQTAGLGAGVLQVVLSADEPAEIPGISVKSPDPERPYRHNRTLRVSGDVVTTTQVASLTINGESFAELTHAPRESFNKRIPIDVQEPEDGGVTKVPVSIVAQDASGAELKREFEVEVRPVMLDSRESKMPVAVLAFAGQGIDPALAELLRTSTESELVNGERFRIVERTRLQEVLTEQQLSAALGDPNQAIELGKLTPAQIFLVADVFARDQAGVEIKARVISTETSDVVATLDTFIENRDDNAMVATGCAAIVKQLADLYPRLSGEVMAVRQQELLMNWTNEDGVREGAYCLVVKEEEPWVDEATGEVLAPGEFVEVGRAKIQSVQSSGARARTVESTQEGTQLEKGMPAITM